MPTSSWWIGSYPSMPAQTVSVTANSVTENIEIATGSYYLAHSTSSLSLCEAWETALETHSEITTATVILSRDRIVRATCDIAWTATWTDTIARDILGADNFAVSQTTQTCPSVSDYLWVPDRPENPSARLGRHGDTVYDTVVSMSGGSAANIVATQYDERVYNTFDVRYIPNAYYDAGNDGGGEYKTFFSTVVRHFRRFAVYRQTLHDETDTSAASLLGSNLLGPYRMVPGGGPVSAPHTREIANIEKLHRVTMSVVQTPEYS